MAIDDLRRTIDDELRAFTKDAQLTAKRLQRLAAEGAGGRGSLPPGARER